MDLVVTGPANGLGYGVVCVNVVHALRRVGVNACYRPWPRDPNALSPEALHSFREDVAVSIHNARNEWTEKYNHLPHLHIWHEWQLGGPWTGPTIGMPFFETTPIRPDAIMPLLGCRNVVVPSKWAVDVLQSSGLRNASHVRYVGFDPIVYNPTHRNEKINESRTFIHVGKFEIRKGVDLVFRAFAAVRRKKDKLLLLVDNPFHYKWYGEALRLCTEAKLMSDPQSVFMLSPRPTHLSLARLYKSADIGIQPSRGEGWGLPTMEMLACGTKVVATDNTGHGEFVQQMGGFVVKSSGLEPAEDGVFFNGSRQWYHVELSDVITSLKEAMKAPMHTSIPPGYTWEDGARRLVAFLRNEGIAECAGCS